MNKYRIAAIIMLIHGGLIEIGNCLALIPVIVICSDKGDMSSFFSFIVPYLQENMNLMVVIGSVYGIVRVYEWRVGGEILYADSIA